MTRWHFTVALTARPGAPLRIDFLGATLSDAMEKLFAYMAEQFPSQPGWTVREAVNLGSEP